MIPTVTDAGKHTVPSTVGSEPMPGARPSSRRLGAALVVALLFTLASTAFVQFFWRMSAAEFGGPPATFANLCQWDCQWYVTIVRDGYHREAIEHPLHALPDAANWAFFPAFPVVAMGIDALLGAGPEIALLLASKLFLLLAILGFMRHAERELGPAAALPAAAIVAFNPYVIYAHAGYTESLYFCLTTLAFMLLARRHFVGAGLAGAMLSGTRLVGVLFAVSYVIASAIHARRGDPALRARIVLGLMLVPLGLALYMVHLHATMGDALAFANVQIAWERALGNPLGYLRAGLAGGGWDRLFSLSALLGLAGSGWLAWRRRFDYAVFLLGAVMVPLATGLVSIPRYVFWQMPLLFALLDVGLRYRPVLAIGLPFGAGVSALMILAWSSGKYFVV